MGNAAEQVKDFLKNVLPEKDGSDTVGGRIKIKAGGDFIGGDQYHEVNHIHATNSRLLTRDECRALYTLVKQLEEELGESGEKTEKSIHNILGVDNIEVMHPECFKPTEAIFQLLIENVKIRLNADDDGLRAQLDQSASTHAKLVAQNNEISKKLRQWQQAYVDLDVHSKKQSAELLSGKTELTRTRDEAKYARNQAREAKTIIAATRKHLLFSFFALGIAICGAAFGGYKVHALTQTVSQLEVSRSVCEFGGKPYTIGSIIDNIDAPDMECVTSADGKKMRWQAVTPPVKRTPPSRPARPAPQPAPILSEQ